MTAVSRFHLLIESARGQSDPQLEQILLALVAEAADRLKNASLADTEYFQKLVDGINGMTGTKGSGTRIACLLHACQFFFITGQAFTAIQPAHAAIELARLSGNEPLLRKGLTFLGIVTADTGNVSQAIECYAEALELARKLHDVDAECLIWINLGVAFIHAAQYQDAISCYERALQIVDAYPELEKHRAPAYTNIALCALHLEDFKRGLDAAEKSINSSPEPTTATENLSRVMRENNYARLLLEVNNLDKARERCEIARNCAARSNSGRAEIAASIIQGLYDVHAGNIDLGISRLTGMLERARLMRPMLREALIAMVKAHELIGQPEKALVFLRELMDHTRQVQQENALKHHRQHLENLGKSNVQDIATRTFEKREAILREQVAQKELIRKEAETELALAEKDQARRALFHSRIEMLERMAVTAELRDDSTGEHSYRVGKLASLLALEFGCDEETCFMIDIAARLHDIGKIGVPDAVLLKPGKLNDAELQVMRSHPIVGAELLSKSDTPHVQMAEEIARFHHEWWDGNGYPGNLSGSAIPLSARITSLADVFDALTHKRPYKEAWPFEIAVQEIARLSGIQFDPQLTELFIVLVRRLQGEHPNLDAFLGQAATATPFMQARAKIQIALNRPPEVDTGSGSRLDLQR